VDDDRSIEWSAEEFLRNGELVARELVRYLETIRDRPVAVGAAPSELARPLDGDPPEDPEPFDAILHDTVARILPDVAHWNHPRFHGFFSISGSYPSALAELFAAGLNLNAMLASSTPAALSLEALVLRWIADLVGYPPEADGILVPGASLGTFYALVAARDAALPGVRDGGWAAAGAGQARIYASTEAHSSVDKAAAALGLGRDNVVRLEADEAYRLSPGALREAIEDDVRSNRFPLAVVATVGTTATGAVDPLEQIAEVCSAAGVWLHVDAAYGGLWRLLPEVRAITPSLAVADSLVVNPHKALFVSLESSCLYCRNRGALETSFRVVPDYLSTSDDDGEWDAMNRSLQLGRTFGALKLWWVIRSYGLERIAGQFRHALRTARWLEREIDAHPSFRRPAASVFPLVTLQHVRDNRELVRRVNATGKAFVSHATLRDGHVTRVSIGNIRTTRGDAEELWSVLQAAAAALDTTADAQCA
jgi:aromatic-L-amino-acid decarboxylase